MAYPATRKLPDSRLRLALAAILVALAAILAVLPSRANAGDLAAWQIVGFSSDASHYAFAEYGRQDGSGYPYAALYVIDLDQDKYVGGAPFRTLIEDEAASIGQALAEVHAQASGALADYGISQPARLVASDPPGEEDGNRHAIAFHVAPVFPHIDPARNLTLTTLNLPDQEMCASFAPTFGFALALDGVEVYRDNSIPKSRSCPLDYQIAGIVTTMEEPATRAVAMISVMKVGFEGPDRRLIAVPFSF